MRIWRRNIVFANTDNQIYISKGIRKQSNFNVIPAQYSVFLEIYNRIARDFDSKTF